MHLSEFTLRRKIEMENSNNTDKKSDRYDKNYGVFLGITVTTNCLFIWG